MRMPCHSLGRGSVAIELELCRRSAHDRGSCAYEEYTGVFPSTFRRVHLDLFGIWECIRHLLIVWMVSRWRFGLTGINKETLHVSCVADIRGCRYRRDGSSV